MDGQKSVTIRNKLKQGKIKVVKKAEVNGSDEIIPLSGVGFELTNDYNSTVLKGVTDENGEILFENLPVAVGVKGDDGKETIKKIRYTAHEVSGVRNEKYVLANDRTTTLSYTAEEAKRIRTLSFTNTPITGNIYLEKADARTKEALSGAEFTVYNDTNGNGKYDKNDTLATGYILSESNGQAIYTPHNTLVEVMETTDDEDGQTVTKGTGRYELYSLEKGKYVVAETKTPVGYVIEQKEFAFEINEDGQIVHVYEKDGKPVIGNGSETVDANEDQFVYNTPIFGDIYLHKIDASNKERLSGAVFHVWKDDGSGKLNTKKDELCGTMTELKGSDGKGTGEYEMNDLPYGTYFVTEVKAPEGYMRSKKTYTVEVRQNRQRVFIDDVENPPIKGNVSVVKIDAYTKEQLADAEFTVYADINKDGVITKGTDTVYSKLIYNAASMTYTLNDLPYGEYVLAETKAPAGHVLTKKVYPFRIIDNGVTVEVNDDGEIGIPNDPIEGYIKVIKKDKKADIPVEGAEFTLYDSKGKAVKKVTTDKEGIADFGKLVYGKYTVKETTAPKHYVLDDTPIPFEILEHGKTYSFTQKETPKPGCGYLKKTSEDGALEGFSFRIYGKSHSGVSFDETHTTDKNGEINVELLPGNYTVEEVKTPSRYIQPESKNIRIEVDETTPVSFDNKLKKGSIIIRKFDKKHPDITVSGAVFTVYQNGKEYKKLAETSKGVYELKNIPYGDYTVKETSAPEGYLLDTGTYDFSIRNDGELITISNSKNDKFVETMIEGSVELVKKDSKTRKPLENAEFTIYSVKDGKTEFYKALMTDKDGKLAFTEIPYGDYIIKETKAPEGYNIDTGEYPFSIKENGQVFKLVNTPEDDFIETQIEGTVQLIKKDSENDDPIEGAEFTLYDGGKEVFRVGYTDAEGKLSFTEVPYGDYTIKETKAPEGYLPDTKSYPLNIKTHQQVITVSNSTDGTFRENPIKGSIELYKVDKNTRKPLAGAEFTLFDDKGTSVQKITTDKNGKAVFSKVRYGKYTVKETKAPTKYAVISDDIPFEVLEHGKVYKFEAEDPEIPGCGYLKKTSEDGVLEGFKFHIYGTSDSGNKVDRTLTTNDKGEIRIELFEGTYTFEEVDAPDRYLTTAKQTVKIISDKTTEMKFDNKLKKGNIEVLKLDGTTKKPLEGAEFTLYKSTGEIVQKVTSNGEGKAVFSDLPFGEYNVVETKAPDEYTADSTPIPFSIVEHGKTLYHTKENLPVPGHGYLKKTSEDGIVEDFKFHVYGVSDTGVKYDNTISTDAKAEFNIELLKGTYTVEEIETPVRYIQPEKQTVRIEPDKNTEIKFENKLKKGNIEILKIDDTTQKPLAGAEFTLYDAKGNAVQVLTTGEDGKVTFTDVPYGEYTVVETKAPEDYTAESAPIPFSIVEHGKTLYHTKDNTPKPGYGYLKKTSGDGVVEGFKFHVYGTSDTGIAFDKTITTDKNGEFRIELLKGTYTVEEIETPVRYIQPEKQTVRIEPAKTTEIKFENKLKKGNIEILKIDETTQKPLAGAEFTLFDAKGNIVQVLTTGADGKVTFKEVPYGKYTVVETKVPDKYKADSTPIPFSIVEHGKTLYHTKENMPVPGHGYLKKTSEDGIVEGFKFHVYGTSDTGVIFDETITTDVNGEFTLELLEGTYTVEEIEVPDRYIQPDKQTVRIRSGKTATIRFENVLKKSNISLVKKDSKNNKPIEGAEFTLYNSDGEAVMTMATDEEGKLTFSDIPYGGYTVKETKAPKGYIRDKKTYPVSVINDGETLVVSNHTDGTFREKPIEGTIEIIKIDEKTSKPLSGAEFTLYNAKGKSVQVVVTGDDGKAIFADVRYGTYTVVETKAPDKYTADPTPIPFSIVKEGLLIAYEMDNTPTPGVGYLKKTSEDGIVEGFKFHVYGTSDTGVAFDETITTDENGEFSIELLEGEYTVEEVETPDRYIQPDKQSIRIESGKTTSAEFDNRLKKGNIEIIKIDEVTRKPLAEAEFTLYDSEDNVVLVLTTDESGMVSFENVPYGDYHVAETKAPDDYVLDSTPVPFSIIENGMLIALEKENTPDSGSPEIVKESEDGVIENVGFHIYGTAKNGVEINETVYTDKEGKFLMENLLVGTYTVEEIEMPDRYIAQEPQTVEVIANEKNVVTFENLLKKGSVTTTKVDAKYPDHKLSGAVFEIFDADHNSVGLMEEIETGIYRLDNLTYGKYILKEIKAPEYYELDTNDYSFEITENGDVRNIETLAGVGFINNAKKGSLVITKRSSDNKLEGFSFRITGKAFTGQEYDEVFTTDKDGKITVDGLRVGSYTVSEISDETIVRYILPDDKEITIPANNTAEIEMFNDEKTIPFEITKKDISTGELIPDCGFRIRNSDGEIVIEGRTDKNGIAKFELVCGDYTYQEFDAPEGYIIDTKEYPFTINPNDTIVKAEMTNIGTGTIEITKKDISTGELIPDCGIKILDENNKVIFQGRTDSEGVVTFGKLPYGKYYYREFDAPEGYVLDETPYPFEMKKNGEIVKATMTNKPVEKEPGYITTDKPKEPGEVTVPTGDMTDFIVIMLVLTAGLSLALIVFNIRASRKKNNKN